MEGGTYIAFEGDGATLCGEVYVPAAPNGAGVVLCHGFGTAHGELDDLARTLRDDGFAVLSYDERAHGRSGGAFDLDGMVGDVGRAREALAERLGVERVGVFGHSLGAYLAVRAAAEEGGFGAVVAWAAPTSPREVLRDTQPGFAWWEWLAEHCGGLLHYSARYRELAIDDMGRFLAELYDRGQARLPDAAQGLGGTPCVVIQGAEDAVVPRAHADEVYAAIPGERELLRVEGCGHSCLASHSEPPFFLPEPARPDGRRRVVEAVVDGFRRYLVGGA